MSPGSVEEINVISMALSLFNVCWALASFTKNIRYEVLAHRFLHLKFFAYPGPLHMKYQDKKDLYNSDPTEMIMSTRNT